MRNLLVCNLFCIRNSCNLILSWSIEKSWHTYSQSNLTIESAFLSLYRALSLSFILNLTFSIYRGKKNLIGNFIGRNSICTIITMEQISSKSNPFPFHFITFIAWFWVFRSINIHIYAGIVVQFIYTRAHIIMG